MPRELEGMWMSSTSRPFFLNRPSCCAINMPLWAPVTAVQLIRTFCCADAGAANSASRMAINGMQIAFFMNFLLRISPDSQRLTRRFPPTYYSVYLARWQSPTSVLDRLHEQENSSHL